MGLLSAQATLRGMAFRREYVDIQAAPPRGWVLASLATCLLACSGVRHLVQLRSPCWWVVLMRGMPSMPSTNLGRSRSVSTAFHHHPKTACVLMSRPHGASRRRRHQRGRASRTRTPRALWPDGAGSFVPCGRVLVSSGHIFLLSDIVGQIVELPGGGRSSEPISSFSRTGFQFPFRIALLWTLAVGTTCPPDSLGSQLRFCQQSHSCGLDSFSPWM